MKLLLALCIGFLILGTYSAGAEELPINEKPTVGKVKPMDQPTTLDKPTPLDLPTSLDQPTTLDKPTPL